MTYHMIYKTTNCLNGRYYFGVHSSETLNDSYLGSGKLLREAIKKYGSQNFTREIIAFYDTREDALLAEKKIIDEKILNDEKSYNLIEGGGDPPHCGYSYPRPDASERMKKDNPSTRAKGAGHWSRNTIVVVDDHDNRFRVNRNDPRIGVTLKSLNKGRVSVKDASGNQFQVSVDDERYLSGELIPIGTGKKKPLSDEGKRSWREKRAIWQATLPKKEPRKKLTEEVKCPHCDFVGKPHGGVYRWHFDNCKAFKCA